MDKRDVCLLGFCRLARNPLPHQLPKKKSLPVRAAKKSVAASGELKQLKCHRFGSTFPKREPVPEVVPYTATRITGTGPYTDFAASLLLVF